MTTLTLKSTVNKKLYIITRVSRDHCAFFYVRCKTFIDTELWKLCLAGVNRIINFQRRTNQTRHG